MRGDVLGTAFVLWLVVCGLAVWLFPDALLAIGGPGVVGVAILVVAFVVLVRRAGGSS